MRMGRDKALLTFRGKPLIEHSLSIVREAGASEVLISGRAGQDFAALGCPVLLDITPDCGPLGGIERGLDTAEHPLVLMLAVDLPHMTPACVRWLFARGRDAFRRVPTHEEGTIDPAVGAGPLGAVPILHGQLEPLAALYPKRAYEIVSVMLREKRFAARDCAERCVQEGLVQMAPVPMEHQSCFVNWNTPEDAKP